MTGICGWVSFAGTPVEAPSWINAMHAALVRPHPDGGEKISGNRHAVAATSLSRHVHSYCDDDITAVIIGQPRWKNGDAINQDTPHNVARTVAMAFRQHGPTVLNDLHGTFAIALVLAKQRQTLLAIDRAGICPLSYTFVDSCLIFGSRPDVLVSHPLAPRQTDPQAIFNYLYFHAIPSPGCIYKGHVKLPPAGYVFLDGGRLKTGTYWQLDYSRETNPVSMRILVPEFREALRQSVRHTLGESTTGAFLSGGTDSSTVAGLLTELQGQAAPTYSIGFDEAGYDEIAYARIAARHFGTDHHEYYVTPDDVAQAIPAIARAYGEPFGNSSAVPAYYCARMAKQDGVQTLLAGDGGDELFGGNTRYAKQYVFGLYDHLPKVVRETLIEPMVNSMPFGDHIPPFRKLRSYIHQASLPMPQRLESYNLLERMGLANVLETAFLEQVNTTQPLTLLTDVYWSAHARTTLNRMLALDYKFTLADNDLPKVNGAAHLAGIDVGYPLLDDDLVAFAARLPIRLKVKHTKLRYFFKHALADFLPPAIIAKKKHGFGLPFGPWLLSAPPLRRLCTESLESLKARGIIRPSFIDDLLHTRLQQHPGFYGVMAWVLLMLEQWFTHHVDNRR